VCLYVYVTFKKAKICSGLKESQNSVKLLIPPKEGPITEIKKINTNLIKLSSEFIEINLTKFTKLSKLEFTLRTTRTRNISCLLSIYLSAAAPSISSSEMLSNKR